MSSTSSELSFAQTYFHLLQSSSTPTATPHFSSNHVASQAQAAQQRGGAGPIIMTKMPNAKKQTKRVSGSATGGAGSKSAGANGGRPFTVTVKSIKAPKFTAKYESQDDQALTSTSTILDLKARLVADQKAQGVAITEAAIRLLVKGKVMPDSKQLGEVAGSDDVSELSFMAMVSAVAPADAAPPSTTAAAADAEKSPVPEADADPEAEAPVELSAQVWAEIGQVLGKNLGGAKAAEALLRLKKGWEASA